jgi:hypothetical protein
MALNTSFNGVTDIDNALSETGFSDMNKSVVRVPAPSMEPIDPALPQQTQPQSGVSAVPTNEDEPSLIGDLALAPIRGILDATEEVAQLVTLNNVSDGTINFLGDSKTTAGNVVQSATSFLAGFTPGFGYLSTLSKVSKLKKYGQLGLLLSKKPIRGAVAGAVADFSVFDEHQQRLSNLIEEVPALQNPITDYLSSKEDDGIFMGRVKNALEGVAIGTTIEGIIKGVKALKGARNAADIGNAQEARKILENAGIEMEQVLKNENALENPIQTETIFKQKETPAFDAEMELPVGQTKPPMPPLPENPPLLADGRPAYPTIPTPPEEAIIETGVAKVDPLTGAAMPVKMKVAEYIGSAPKIQKFLEIYNADPANLDAIRRTLMDGDTPIINIGKHSGPDSVSRTKTAVVKVLADAIESTKGAPRKQDEVLSDAMDLVKQWDQSGSYVAEWTKKAGSLSRLDAEVRAMQIVSSDMLGQMGQKAQAWSEATKRFKENPFDLEAKRIATEEEINLLEMWPKMSEMILAYKAQGTNLGRGLAARRWTKDLLKKADAYSKSGREPLEGGAQMFWAKNARTMDEYLTQIRAEQGNGDIEAGTKAVSEALSRMATLFDDYGPYGLVKIPPNKFWIKLHNELWINSLLSGPKTFAVNTLGNAITTLYKPFEAAMGAQVAYMKSGFQNETFKNMRNAYLRSYGTLFSDIRDAFKASTQAFKTGESGLVPNSAPIEMSEQIITKENFAAKLREFEMNHPDASPITRGLAKFMLTNNLIDSVGKGVRLPTRFLMAMDEFTKQVNFRNFAKARALTEALDANPNLTMAEAASLVQDKLDSLVMQGGRLYSEQALRMKAAVEGRSRGMFGLELTNYIEEYTAKNFDPTKSQLAEYAFSQAQEATFTKRGAPGTIQKSVERFVGNHPVLRTIVPFVTTPTNILKFFGQRAVAPLPAIIESSLRKGKFQGLQNARLELTKELMSSDPFVKAHAEGKIAMGTSIVGLALAAKLNGLITGQASNDEKERTLKQATGWLPYSFKVADRYIQYQRLDPFATFLGVISDFDDRIQQGLIRDEGAIEMVSSAIATAVAKNITSKSYLTGIQQVMEALDNPDRKMDRFIQTRVGSLVVPAIVAQATPIGDPYMREARSIMDAVTRRLPGESGYLDPKRNIIGEPIERPEGLMESGIDEAFSPISISKNKQDKVMDELSSLGYGFSMPPVVEKGGINLADYRNKKGQSAYDRYMELTSTLKINNKSLRESLSKLIGSRKYQQLDPQNLMDEFESPRVAEIKKVIGKYRSYAREKMLTEFPDLFKDRELRDRIKIARQRGDSITAQRLLSQLQMEPVFNE